MHTATTKIAVMCANLCVGIYIYIFADVPLNPLVTPIEMLFARPHCPLALALLAKALLARLLLAQVLLGLFIVLLLLRLEVPPRGLQLALHLLPSLVAVLAVVPVAVAGVFVFGCSSGRSGGSSGPASGQTISSSCNHVR